MPSGKDLDRIVCIAALAFGCAALAVVPPALWSLRAEALADGPATLGLLIVIAGAWLCATGAVASCIRREIVDRRSVPVLLARSMRRR